MKDKNTEIREAIDAGNRALGALDEAEGSYEVMHFLSGTGAWAYGICWAAAFSAASSSTLKWTMPSGP